MYLCVLVCGACMCMHVCMVYVLCVCACANVYDCVRLHASVWCVLCVCMRMCDCVCGVCIAGMHVCAHVSVSVGEGLSFHTLAPSVRL